MGRSDQLTSLSAARFGGADAAVPVTALRSTLVALGVVAVEILPILVLGVLLIGAGCAGRVG